jgi:hypothetical protein
VLGRLSLRARLLLGVIAIAAVGLLAADLATYTALRSFLIDRVDSALDSVHPGVDRVFFPLQGQPGPGPGGDVQALFNQIPGYCLALRSTSGHTITNEFCIPQFGQSQAAPGPQLPAKISVPAKANTPEGDRVRFFTASGPRSRPATRPACWSSPHR